MKGMQNCWHYQTTETFIDDTRQTNGMTSSLESKRQKYMLEENSSFAPKFSSNVMTIKLRVQFSVTVILKITFMLRFLI